MKYQEIFNELIESPKSNNKYQTRLVEFDKNNPCKYKVILAVDKDENNQQCVMLQLKNGGEKSNVMVNNINTINSVKIEILPADSESELDVYYSIKLIQNTEDEIFYSFITDIISTAKKSKLETPVLDILKRVKLWINFFKSKSSISLNENNQVGLFAELIVLKGLLKYNPSNLLETVLCWVGPKGQNQDFVFSNKTALEVKCTTNNNPFEISISNEFQLDNTGLEKLFLCVSQVKRFKKNDWSSFPTLPSIITEIRTIIADDFEALFEFNCLLLEVGYLEECELEYLNYGFQIFSDPNYYEVGNEFPKLSRAILPNSITKVEYKLNIQDQKGINENVFQYLKV